MKVGAPLCYHFCVFQIQCYHFCTRTPFPCYQFCSSVLPFLRLDTLYIIRKIYIFFFYSKQNLKKKNSKRAYARSAHARRERYFVYSQQGRKCCSCSFSCRSAIMAKIVLIVCYHFCAWIVGSLVKFPSIMWSVLPFLRFLYCNVLIFWKQHKIFGNICVLPFLHI